MDTTTDLDSIAKRLRFLYDSLVGKEQGKLFKTQTEFLNAIEVRRTLWNNWLDGTREPGLRSLEKLALRLNLNMNWLILSGPISQMFRGDNEEPNQGVVIEIAHWRMIYELAKRTHDIAGDRLRNYGLIGSDE